MKGLNFYFRTRNEAEVFIFVTTDCQNQAKSNPRSSVKRTSLQLCIRLVFVMGLGWILELVHSLVDIPPHSQCGWMEILLKIGGTFNVARGIFMFIIFICKKRIFNQLLKIFRNEKNAVKQRTINRHDTTLFRLG